jgi:hypothetical protein
MERLRELNAEKQSLNHEHTLRNQQLEATEQRHVATLRGRLALLTRLRAEVRMAYHQRPTCQS